MANLTPQAFVDQWRHVTLNERAAYGWPENLGDEEIMERLLALNLERAKGGTAQRLSAEEEE